MIPLPPNLPELYAKVCERRPECAIEGLLFERFFWTHPQCQGAIKETAAASIIFAHWSMVLMECGSCLRQSIVLGGHFAVLGGYFIERSNGSRISKCPNPLSAIAEYFLEGSSK